ncbi:TIGR00266 family protein [Thermoanaerobacter thermohydrosulfuricus]|uniref:TIGR00266 family protein n=1 Tax=Thermoanaerobacter thermohydrosulfuricus TaxID=1516 RepID=A0A1G7MTM6_THETY|nr:TIGR00266 family protein [Thermoanaerobacter thermohydrosulfuricus]SDF64479.1 TIGR00266 family protein [Thermoanaerobacter thermohydrosulfuricus]
MEFKIIGEPLPVVILTMREGESVLTQSSGMAWMSDGFEMKTGTEGGLLKGIARVLAGETLFMTRYTCNRDMGEIAFASSFPGEIIPLELKPGQSIICQKKAFLCGESTVKLEPFFMKKLTTALFGGEGFVLEKITGPGVCFVEIDGSVVKYELGYSDVLKVDPGHIAMFEESVEFNIETIKGVRNIMFSGEGLFLSTLKGPGRVWLQSMPIENLAARLIPYLPERTSE